MVTLREAAQESIASIRESREINGATVIKLFVGVTVHEQHVGGPNGDQDAELHGWDLDLVLPGNGYLVWHPWAALLATTGRKTPRAVQFPMDTGHDIRGIGRILADKPNFFAFEHHTGNVLFTLTADEFFEPRGESDWR